MPTYDISRPTIVDDDGSGETGTLFNNQFWNDDVFDAIDAVFDDVEMDIGDLQTQGYLKNYDTVLYEYKDAAAVTLQAGGQFTSSDGLAFYTIASNTDVGFASNLSSDVSGGEAANTLYYIWGGEDNNGDQEFWITDSPTVMPSELAKGKRLRGAIYNDGSSNILPFLMSQKYYYYNTSVICGGSDATEVLDTTLSVTTWTDVDCSPFVPAGIDFVILSSYLTHGATTTLLFRARQNGTSHNGFYINYDQDASTIARYLRDSAQMYPVDDNGIIEIYSNVAATARISVLGYLI